MDCTSTRLSYRQTGVFSKIAADYADQAQALMPFVAHAPTLAGIHDAIAARKAYPTDRKMLVDELKKQYAAVEPVTAVQKNIDLLLSPDTFTVTTAHQNNIFTGPLYFIYKIIHAIKLADYLNQQASPFKFVPVYYIGSEDADLEELNHIHLGSEKLVWNTKQKGAVGRMKIDQEFIKLIDVVEGQVGVLPYGARAIERLRKCYKKGADLQAATFEFIHTLMADKGLVVLLPDNASLKSQMKKIFADDLLNQTASGIVQQTSERLAQQYKVQAHPRAINLFYLESDIRERIELNAGKYKVLNTQISFSEAELLQQLDQYPERFSPNVILRGLYQETILPNIAFIGGGGELAYWLELKDLFDYYKVPFPVQVLRNSFLVVESVLKKKIEKLGFTVQDIFLSQQDLLNRLVNRESGKKVQLNGTLSATAEIYEHIRKQVAQIDVTLEKHVDALKANTLQRLQQLEKKMLRAEKRKFTDQQQQLSFIRSKLFPGDSLQERHDNMLLFYAKWGDEFIGQLYNQSLALEQEFVILEVEG